MALTLGTNVGFVLTAPTADPAGSDTTIDGSSVVVKDTSPAGAVKITQIGWYRGTGTSNTNFEVALYSESAGVASTRVQVDNTNSPGTTTGWKTVTVDWTISPSTAYWLGLQMDAHTGSSTVDSAASGGSGIDLRTSQTTLNDPYGGGAVSDADGMYAIYALVQIAPTVALSSPADAGTTTDTTPDLVFTGTDTNGDDIRYNIQIYQQIATDDFNRADNSSTGMNLGANWTASVPEFDLGINSNQAYETVGGGNDNVAFWSANTFANNQYSKVTLANATGSPYVIVRASATDYVLGQFNGTNYKIYWYNSGAYTEIATGAGSITNGDILELQAVGTTFSLYKNGVLAISGTNASAPSSGKPGIGIDDGATRLDDWSGGNIIVNAVSGTDAGFSGSPDNTDPFASAQAVTYTVQSALTDVTTYYWRVRGVDPSGSNTYGAWATTRSFTVNTGGGPATTFAGYIGGGWF